MFDHTSSSIIFSYWIPKSIKELKQSSQLKSVFYKKLKKHWNVEGSLKFKLRMPKVWRKKQKLKSLPAESQRLWELNLSWICWTSKSGCFRFFFTTHPFHWDPKSQCSQGQIHQFSSSAWKVSSKRKTLKKIKITLFLHCSITLLHPFYEWMFKRGVLIICCTWLNEISCS